MRNLIAWLRAFTLVALILGGCAPSTFYPLPEQRETRTLMQLVESGEVEALDLDGLDPVLPDIENAFQNLDNVGLLEGSDEGYLSRQSHSCQVEDRGKLKGIKLKALYGPDDGIETKYDQVYEGLAFLGYVDQTVPDLDPYNGAHVWEIRFCSIDFDGYPLLETAMLWIPGIGWEQEVDLIDYAHGTSVYRYDDPTNLNVDDTFDGISTGLIFVAGDASEGRRGNIVVLPSYPGLGPIDNGSKIRYFDPVSSAAAMLDARKAAKEAIPFFAVYYSGEDYGVGFSLGGFVIEHATREAQVSGNPFAGTIVLSGLPDPRPWEPWLWSQEVNYLMMPSALLTTSLLEQGKLPGWSASTIFNDPSVMDLFDTYTPYYLAVEGTPDTAEELYTLAWRNAAANSNHGHLAGLNATAGWCPTTTPIVLYHAIEDDEAPEPFIASNTAAWQAACPGSSIQYITYNQTTGVSAHLQSWDRTQHLVPVITKNNMLNPPLP